MPTNPTVLAEPIAAALYPATLAYLAPYPLLACLTLIVAIIASSALALLVRLSNDTLSDGETGLTMARRSAY